MLCNLSDTRPVLWVFLYFALTWLAWLQPHTCFSTVAVLCYFSFAGACITHNSMHCRTFVSPLHETIWRHLLSGSYGHPVSTFVPGHNLSHHRYTQTAMDPMRTSKLRYRHNLLNLLLFQPTVSSGVFRLDVQYLLLKRHCRHSYYSICVNEWLLLAVSQLTLLMMDPAKFLILVWVPHLFAQWAIVTMNLLQHDGCDVDSDNALNGSRNFTGSIVNFLTFNNGLHTIHHMNPKLHWSKLPENHEKLVRGKNNPNLNQCCMATYAFKTFVYPGKRVDYMGEAVKLPPAEPDADWIIHHTPEGVTRKDYDVCTADLFKLLPLLPIKIMCPTYSAQFKVD